MNQERYWIAVISRDHAQRATDGGFIQVCHGKQGPLKRMRKGDWVMIYSPKRTMEGNEKYQCFTAIGQVDDEEPYSFRMTEHFVPFRRNIKFYNCHEISILPLINDLAFIPNKTSWGYPFRFGFLEIKEPDFQSISRQMHLEK